ncbi:MAG: NADH-quinone oxidoreductase subunit L [Deltaproteobacteria bacterium]|nr:NADH-quinone oxidoreductase subunit L [Deltaproteobacteria bacterium]
MVMETTASTLVRWIPLLPLSGALFLGFFSSVVRRSFSRGLLVSVSCLGVLASFAVCCLAFSELLGMEQKSRVLVDSVYSWIGVGLGNELFTADLAFRFDALSGVMCLVVTGVGLLVFAYSAVFMEANRREDGGPQRFYCYMLLFVAAMLFLVLGDNLVVLFLGWEAVGLASALLITFWYGERFTASAGTKAFLVNRIGDFGLMLGLLLLFWSLADAGVPGTSFRVIESGFPIIADQSLALPGGLSLALPELIGFCFLLAACAKSAQLPLQLWLADSMVGPTPASALIHASTMVTAGIYLFCRFSFLYEAAPLASSTVAWIGAVTALAAAMAASVQVDVKRLLAYSTMSQLGFIFVAVGCGAFGVAMFHLVTHSFVKALLLLGLGAVSLSLDQEQDLQRMGGLRGRLVWTHVVLLIGVLGMAGVPPLSGFFSKGEILVAAFVAEGVPHHRWLYGAVLFAAGVTAFYSFRMLFMIFYGRSRVPMSFRGTFDDPSIWLMWPMYVLAFLTVVAGVLNPSQFWGDMISVESSDSLSNFLAGSITTGQTLPAERNVQWSLIGYSTVALLLGLALAYLLYLRFPKVPKAISRAMPTFQRGLVAFFNLDELPRWLVERPLLGFSKRVLAEGVERRLIDGVLVTGTALGVRGLADGVLRHLQNGLTQTYLFFVLVGTLVVLASLLR